MTNNRFKGLMQVRKIFSSNHEINKKDWNLLVRETFFPYFCHSTIKKKEYEHKTEKIYFARR